MGHGITDKDSMVSTNRIPWHGLGARVDHLMTPEEAVKEGGLDWTVGKRPLLVEHADGQHNYLKDWVATVRESDGLPLGAVKPNYPIIQNLEIAEFQAAVLNVLGKDERLVETCGSLFGGRVVWFLSHIPKDIDLGSGGKIEAFQVIAASHNATLPVICKNTPTRVECANTLDMSIHGSGNTYRFKHTLDWKSKVFQAQEALDLTFKYLDALEVTAKDLMRQKMTYKDLLAFTVELFPSASTDETAVPTRTQNRRNGVLEMLHADNLANIKATKWGAYNAVAEWVDHHGTFRETEGGSKEDNRAYSILTGQASVLKNQALSILLKK